MSSFNSEFLKSIPSWLLGSSTIFYITLNLKLDIQKIRSTENVDPTMDPMTELDNKFYTDLNLNIRDNCFVK